MPRKVVQEQVRTRTKQNASMKPLALVIVVCVILAIGAIILGRSDSGEIDVNAAIESSNQIRNEESSGTVEEVETIPEVFRNMGNGGLVPQGAAPEPVPVEEGPAVEEGAETGTTTDEEAVPGEEAEITAEGELQVQ